MTARCLEIDASRLLWAKIQIYAGSGPPHGVEPIDFRTILALRAGQTWAQDLYLETFWPTLEPEVRHYARKGGDREELEQDAALALWEAAFRYDPALHRTRLEVFVKNHIHRTVREHYIQSIKRQRRQILMEDDAGVHGLKSDDNLDLAETQMDVGKAFLALSPHDQRLLHRFAELTIDYGMGLEEASRFMAAHEGGTAAAWKKRIQRLRHKWREQMQSPRHG